MSEATWLGSCFHESRAYAASLPVSPVKVS